MITKVQVFVLVILVMMMVIVGFGVYMPGVKDPKICDNYGKFVSNDDIVAVLKAPESGKFASVQTGLYYIQFMQDPEHPKDFLVGLASKPSGSPPNWYPISDRFELKEATDLQIIAGKRHADLWKVVSKEMETSH